MKLKWSVLTFTVFGTFLTSGMSQNISPPTPDTPKVDYNNRVAPFPAKFGTFAENPILGKGPLAEVIILPVHPNTDNNLNAFRTLITNRASGDHGSPTNLASRLAREDQTDWEVTSRLIDTSWNAGIHAMHKWTILPLSDGRFMLQNSISKNGTNPDGFCLSNNGASTKSARMKRCTLTDQSQHFFLQPANRINYSTPKPGTPPYSWYPHGPAGMGIETIPEFGEDFWDNLSLTDREDNEDKKSANIALKRSSDRGYASFFIRSVIPPSDNNNGEPIEVSVEKDLPCLNVWSSRPEFSSMNFESCENLDNESRARKTFVFHRADTEFTNGYSWHPKNPLMFGRNQRDLENSLLGLASIFHLMDYEKGLAQKKYSYKQDLITRQQPNVTTLHDAAAYSPVPLMQGGTRRYLIGGQTAKSVEVKVGRKGTASIAINFKRQAKHGTSSTLSLTQTFNGGFDKTFGIGFQYQAAVTSGITHTWEQLNETSTTDTQTVEDASEIVEKLNLKDGEIVWWISYVPTTIDVYHGARNIHSFIGSTGTQWEFAWTSASGLVRPPSGSIIHCSSTKTKADDPTWYDACRIGYQKAIALERGLVGANTIDPLDKLALTSNNEKSEEVKVLLQMGNSRCLSTWNDGSKILFGGSTDCPTNPNWPGSYWYLERIGNNDTQGPISLMSKGIENKMDNRVFFRLRSGADRSYCVQAPWNRLTAHQILMRKCADAKDPAILQQIFSTLTPGAGLHLLAFNALKEDARRSNTYFPYSNVVSAPNIELDYLIATSSRDAGLVKFIPFNP